MPPFLARFLWVILSCLLVLGVVPGPRAEPLGADVEVSIGSPDATVTIVEYASLTCPHCAAFHAQSLPALKERYIDSGKVRLVFADFPLDRLALAASMVARCAGKDRYFAFIDVLFKQQRAWATASDPIAAIKKLAKIGGMSEAAVDGCLADAALQEGIIKRSYDASKDHGIKSTPSFLINGKLLKDQPFNRETMDAILAPLLS